MEGGQKIVSYEDKRKIAIEETAKWVSRQTEQVWRALKVWEEEKNRELRIKSHKTETEHQFVYRGNVLAEARSYFCREERQWKFEVTWVDQEQYQAVREYFAKQRQKGRI